MTLFPFRGAESHASTFCDPAIVKSLICKESENHAFRFPRSKKPIADFLRPYQDSEQPNGWAYKDTTCGGLNTQHGRNKWI